MLQRDKAGQEYWDDIWATAGLPRAADPRAPGSSNFICRRYHALFRRAFASMPTEGKRLLEIGCARSVWLPYFAMEFGFQVTGLDYSKIGCRQARAILSREKVEGQIFCADLFSPPACLEGACDVVVSFGVAEHFQDTTGCIRAFSRYLRPGGMLITTIPNLAGLNGQIQKRINRAVYDVHVSLDRPALARAHWENRLEVVFCEYFVFSNLGVLNFEHWRGRRLYAIASELRFRVSQPLWFLEERTRLLPPNRWTSPYIACIAVKPCV